MASASCVELLPLCSATKVSAREGQVGAVFYSNFIGIGFWSPSGGTLSFPNSQAVQDKSKTYLGLVKPDTFSKGFSCDVPGACGGFTDPGPVIG